MFAFRKKSKQLSYGYEKPPKACPTNKHSFDKTAFFSLTIAENFRGYALGSIIFREFGNIFKQFSYGFIELSEVFYFLKT